jgi:hypothetical protein
MRAKLQAISRAVQARLSSKTWPRPPVRQGDETHLLFIVTPPYSGSTALAQILKTGRGSAFLQRRAEGQWLVPGMSAPDRWDPGKRMDWTSIRSVWLNRIEMIESLGQEVELIIEKSPPNMVRIDQLTQVFPLHSLLAFNRDPFAACSSVLYREFKPEGKGTEARIQLVSKLARDWLSRSRMVKSCIEKNGAVSFSYEAFCADPNSCLAALVGTIPSLATIDVSRSIRVKDYQQQPLANQNSRQIKRLSAGEIRAIAKVLGSDPELVAFFGYDAKGSSVLEQEQHVLTFPGMSAAQSPGDSSRAAANRKLPPSATPSVGSTTRSNPYSR